MHTLQVFAPWVAIGLFMAIMASLDRLMQAIKQAAWSRKEKRELIQHGKRLYTFTNNRGY